ncbi:hypothetical protein ACU686_20655 [Yinghuangia aomiensis]
MAEVPATANGAVFTAAYTASALGRLTGFWTWPGGYDRLVLDVIDAPLCTLADIRGFEVELRDATRYPPGLLVAAREAVTEEFTRIVGRSFVIRAGRVVERVDQATAYLGLPEYDVITVALSVGWEFRRPWTLNYWGPWASCRSPRARSRTARS